MADSRLAPSQWETSLQSNAVSHWLGANLESTLYYIYWDSDCVLNLSWRGFCWRYDPSTCTGAHTLYEVFKIWPTGVTHGHHQQKYVLVTWPMVPIDFNSFPNEWCLMSVINISHVCCSIKSLPHGRCGSNFKSMILQTDYTALSQGHSLWNYSHVNAKKPKKTPHNENATLVMAWCHPDLCHNMRLIGHNELSGTQNIIIIIVCKHHINVFQNIATDVKKSTAKVITVICLLARQQEAWYQLKWKGCHSDSLITAGSCQVISLKRNHQQQKLSPWWPVYFSVDSVQ